jgi:hypothetical protein
MDPDMDRGDRKKCLKQALAPPPDHKATIFLLNQANVRSA